MFFVDLDRFNIVNETLGHPAGDALLMAMAVRLRERLASDSLVARLGGDEYVIICSLGGSDAGPRAQRAALHAA